MNSVNEEKVREALARLGTMLGGAKLELEEIKEGVVTVRYYRPLTNPSACHVERTRATKDIVLEVLEDVLRGAMPGLKEVVLVGRE